MEMTELSPLLTALNAVMAKVGYVQKTGRNAFHNYTYAGEQDLLEVLRPALVEHGLVLIPSLDVAPTIDEYGNTHLVVAYTLAHTSGATWPEKLRVPGCGNDRHKNGIGDKGTYKALTGANKYLLFKLFQIATGDDPEVPNAMEQTSKLPGPTVSAGVAAAIYDCLSACTTTADIDALMRQYSVGIKALQKTDKTSFNQLKAAVGAKRKELAKPHPTDT